MALSGMHIACVDLSTDESAFALAGAVRWAETLASAGTTANAAPATGVLTKPGFQFRASVDAFVAYGPVPSAAAGQPRLFIAANDTVTVACQPGDKVAWVAA
ncbi:hypothetical protein [Bosea sp. (in: a-proteobacteria)]|uniref:hypothetical protein n=1 Tax=Bosea sp. (in: a-proteobacteria) TaxID=1871050 RepID=UPI003B3A9096